MIACVSERDKESERKIKKIVKVHTEVRLDYKWMGTSGTDTNKMFQKNPPCSQSFCLSPDVKYMSLNFHWSFSLILSFSLKFQAVVILVGSGFEFIRYSNNLKEVLCRSGLT